MWPLWPVGRRGQPWSAVPSGWIPGPRAGRQLSGNLAGFHWHAASTHIGPLVGHMHTTAAMSSNYVHQCGKHETGQMRRCQVLASRQAGNWPPGRPRPCLAHAAATPCTGHTGWSHSSSPATCLGHGWRAAHAGRTVAAPAGGGTFDFSKGGGSTSRRRKSVWPQTCPKQRRSYIILFLAPLATISGRNTLGWRVGGLIPLLGLTASPPLLPLPAINCVDWLGGLMAAVRECCNASLTCSVLRAGKRRPEAPSGLSGRRKPLRRLSGCGRRRAGRAAWLTQTALLTRRC